MRELSTSSLYVNSNGNNNLKNYKMMKQQNIKLLLVLLLSMTNMVAFAYEVNGINYSFSRTEATVTSGSSKYSGNVVIPESVMYNGKTYSVTSIGGYAFYGCWGLTSITIPNSVTSIWDDAFRDCSGLTSVTIPNSVTSIGDRAFYGCSSMTSITIPNSVTSIGWSAFENCSGLTSVTIGNSVTSIGYWAFNGTAWYNIQPDGLVYAGKVAYKYKGTMPSNTSIVIEEGTLGIAGGAFSGCSGLTSVTIPNSVTSIGYEAFYNCSGLTSITIPNSVTSIGEETFYGCSGLMSFTIPNSVTSIGDYAFLRCSGLTSITIPNSVTSIGYRAFYGCSSMTSITIPNSVTSIGGGAFSGCDNLTSVISEITEPFNCGTNAFPDNACRNGTLYVPAGTKDLYIRFDGWRNFLHIEEGGEAAKYQLSFVVNNKELSTKNVEVGATIAPPTTDGEGNTVTWYTYPTTMPAHDLVVYGMVVKQPEPEVLVWLTVKDGQGTTRMKVRQGTEQVLTITPEEGWKVVSVTWNGTDVTAQTKDGGSYTTPAITGDATLAVVYEQDAPSNVASARAGQATVTVVDDGVVIAHAEPQSRCVVYASNGQPVVSTVIEGDSQKIRLQKGQVYILTINGRTLKFAL